MSRRDDGPALETTRLLLRPWSDDDLEPFAALNADPRVMEHFPALMDRATSDAQATRWRAMFAEHGLGMWAVEEKEGAPFIGFVGLSIPAFEAAFTPCVEVGWRLAADYWGRGYATEAALASLAFGFGSLGLARIVSYTARPNLRSEAVMQRLGMKREAKGDFIHPLVPAGHRLAWHVLYAIDRADWDQSSSMARMMPA
jgi:RimJ/RimL family protein N-acetyltransferase